MNRKCGRSFSNSDDEKTNDINTESVNGLLKKLENIEYVLENAALAAALMRYVINKTQDINALLFYYVFRKYEKICETRNSKRNYQHLNSELFTIFIHPQSILRIPINDNNLFSVIEENIPNAHCIEFFGKLHVKVVNEILATYLEQYRNHINLGLEHFAFDQKLFLDGERKRELQILETTQSEIRNQLVRLQKSRCLPSNKIDTKNMLMLQDFQIKATFIGLTTQYEYFTMSKHYSYIVTTPFVGGPGKTFVNESNTTKPLKRAKVKGHSLNEYFPTCTTDCDVCENILWGTQPQGYSCKNCKMSFHNNCKDSVKPCPGEKRKTVPIAVKDGKEIPIYAAEPNSDAPDLKQRRLSDPLSSQVDSQSATVFGSTDSELDHKSTSNIERQGPKTTTFNVSDISKPGLKILQKLSEPKGGSVFYDEQKKKTTIGVRSNHQVMDIKHTSSMNMKSDSTKIDTDVSRSKSARSTSQDRSTQGNQAENKSYPRNRLQSDEISIKTDDAFSIAPLIPWDSDSELMVPETFEAEIELKQFPDHKEKSDSKSEYTRLLVLMEFHHKMKFIRMTLKRVKYFLIDPWVQSGDNMDLFESLSLDMIDKLYLLISNLVNIVDKCRQNDTYDNCLADEVYSWLSDSDDNNIYLWLQYSINLCCTNVLHSVKVRMMEQKRVIPQLQKLLSVEVNRRAVIDELANMRRILLFNLPMIVAKIVKDLKKFSNFNAEAAEWDNILQKLKLLPQFINERCMPIVQLINNGTISSSNCRYKGQIQDFKSKDSLERFINNFPKTIFKENFFDFQFIKISNFRESKENSLYVKEEIDAAVVGYDSFLLLLQKDNDKYLLKNFKSLNQMYKIFPLISLDKVHVTSQQQKETNYPYVLTMLHLSQAIMIRMHFKEKVVQKRWMDHIAKQSVNSPKIHFTRKLSVSSYESARNDDQNQVDVTDSPSSNLRISQIISNLEDVCSSLSSTGDMIIKKTSVDEGIDLLKKINQGPSTPTEFLFLYNNILKEFIGLGIQMVRQSQEVDRSLLLQSDIISMRLPALKRLHHDMDILLESQTTVEADSETSSDTECVSEKTNKCRTEVYSSVHDYIENVIQRAKRQIELDSQSNVSKINSKSEDCDLNT